MKLILYLLFVSLSFIFLRCSSNHLLNSSTRDYMPLAIGNKWFYNIHGSNVKGIQKFRLFVR